MDIFQQIKQIPITEVLQRVWIKYKNTMWTLNLYEGQKITDWWKAKINDNFVTDFTWKRPQGDQLAFVQGLMNSNKWEAVEWFKTNFWLIDIDNKFSIQIKEEKQAPEKDVKTIFSKFNKLWDTQKKYLESRCINYELVKDIVKESKWWIACLIYNEKWKVISINTRSITEKRFYIESWTQSKWVYMWDIDRSNKKIYVVEGMFDFLSLRQYNKNIIGLKSVNDWIEVIKEFYNKWYEINIIPDNDEVWLKLLDKFSDIRYNWFDLSAYDVKDINDILINFWIGKDIIDVIEEEKKSNFTDDILIKTKPFTWGTDLADNILSPIERNHYIFFWGSQGQWKTTFTFDVASKNAVIGHKVLYLSLEMETEKLKTNMARSYAGITKQEWRNKNMWEVKQKAYFKRKKQIESNNNLILKWFTSWEATTTDNITKIIQDIKPDLVFIDNFDLIQWDNQDKLTKQEDISKFFLNFTNTYKIPCIILHHMNKWWSWIDWLRWSWKITDDADLVMSWARKDEPTNKEEEKMFIVTELKSRDWGTFENHVFRFHKGTFENQDFAESDFKNNIK